MLKIITDCTARDFLGKMRSTRRGFLNQKFKQSHPRGPGSLSAVVNYGLFHQESLVAVARLSPVPYGKSVAAAAVGKELANFCLYLQREYAVGVTHAELVQFIREYTQRIPRDTGRDYRYLLSLDDPSEQRFFFRGAEWCSTAATGNTYLESGALYGGRTRSKGSGRYILNGKMGNLYHGGKNFKVDELRRLGAQIITETPKDRYIWVLAPPNSLLYLAYRNVLPAHVMEREPGTIWVQPRLITRLKRILQNQLVLPEFVSKHI